MSYTIPLPELKLSSTTIFGTSTTTRAKLVDYLRTQPIVDNKCSGTVLIDGIVWYFHLIYSKSTRVGKTGPLKFLIEDLALKNARRNAHRNQNPALYKAYQNLRRTAENEEYLTTYDYEIFSKLEEERELLEIETGTPHHIDHIIALSKGGSNRPENLMVVTKAQNLSKGTKTQFINGRVWDFELNHITDADPNKHLGCKRPMVATPLEELFAVC